MQPRHTVEQARAESNLRLSPDIDSGIRKSQSGSTGALTREERLAAALGLLLFWTGVLLFGLTVWATVDNVLDAQQANTLSAAHYRDYVDGPWTAGLGLMFVGVVVPRLALRLFGRSDGAG